MENKFYKSKFYWCLNGILVGLIMLLIYNSFLIVK